MSRTCLLENFGFFPLLHFLIALFLCFVFIITFKLVFFFYNIALVLLYAIDMITIIYFFFLFFFNNINNLFMKIIIMYRGCSFVFSLYPYSFVIFTQNYTSDQVCQYTIPAFMYNVNCIYFINIFRNTISLSLPIRNQNLRVSIR